MQLNKKHLIRSFNRAANTYDEVAVLPFEVSKRLLERLSYTLLKPNIIIDLGCGTGKTTQLLKQRYSKAKIIGLDIAEQMLQYHRKQTSWFSKSRLICADAVQIPLANQSVDLIVSNMFLHWYEDITTVLQEVQRVLKPEGLFLFATVGPDTLKELRESWACVDEKPHVHVFKDMHLIGDALLKAHFKDPVIDVENFTLTFTSTKQILQELKAMGVQNAMSDKHSNLTGKDKYHKMVLAYEKFRNQDNLLPVTCEVVYGQAWGIDLSILNKTGTTISEVAVPVSAIRKR